jgi:chromosome transmission fidelity protein 18
VVTDEAIKSSAVGLKDSGTTLQAVWNDIFIPVSAKVRRKTAGIDDGKYVNRLVNVISTSGEYDKVVQGLFEHYPNVKPLDASLQNLCRVHDWIEFYDRLNGKISENQEFELMGYIPYAIVPWHTHMAAPANNTKPTEWPKADYEVRGMWRAER